MLALPVLLYLIAAVTFLATNRLRPYRFSPLVKIIPIIILIGVTLAEVDGLGRVLVLTALIFSAGGDIALELQHTGKSTLFVVGLLLFLIAHLFYISAFC